MTHIDDAMRELRGYGELFDAYQASHRRLYESHSGLYDPDQDTDHPFSLEDFDDGLDPDRPAPAQDLFNPDDWADQYDDGGHFCPLGPQCRYAGGDDECDNETDDDEDDEDDDGTPDASRIVI
jgi:hypothetical protein